MAIKNFLFLVSVSFLITRCASIGRNTSSAGGHGGSHTVASGSPQSSAQAMLPPSPSTFAPPPALPSSSSAPNTVIPVGLYLGPGGMRAFAHVGVLRALQRAQIPIVAVGGVEMGSIVAASFAQAKKSNEVEWQMLKLQKENVPAPSLLHRQYAPKDVEALQPFFKAAFGERAIDNGVLPFRCPFTDGDQTLFVSHGLIREQLSKCVATPPLYNVIEGDGKKWMSGAVAPGDWVGELKRAGAQFIIYVDVISKGSLLPLLGKYENPSETMALWTAVKSLSVQQHAFAHITIEIPMDLDLSDYDNRKNAILLGDQATQTYLSTTLKSIGMAN